MISIEFDCGAVAEDVGMPSMAIQAHIGACEDEACQADVIQAAKSR